MTPKLFGLTSQQGKVKRCPLPSALYPIATNSCQQPAPGKQSPPPRKQTAVLAPLVRPQPCKAGFSTLCISWHIN